MKASVLVHTVERPGALRRCLGSVMEQEHRPLELVLLKVGTSRESAEVIRDARQSASSVGIDFKLVPCEMAGVSRSRNMAAAQASGDVLVCLDDDAEFAHPGAVESAVKRLEGHRGIGLVAGRILLGDSASEDVARMGASPVAQRLGVAVIHGIHIRGRTLCHPQRGL